jgi:hypothetical protein
MNPKEYTKMLSGLISGEEESWNQFIDLFYPLIRGKISALAPNLHTEKLAKDVIENLIKNDYHALKKIVGGFPSFLNFINSLIFSVVKFQSKGEILDSYIEDANKQLESKMNDHPSIEIGFTIDEDELNFREKSNQLDLITLEVIELNNQGYRPEEIADILGTSLSMVQSKLKKSKEDLKNLLGSEIK